MDLKTFWDNWVPIWAISRQIPPAKVIKNGYLFERLMTVSVSKSCCCIALKVWRKHKLIYQIKIISVSVV